jgi:hydrogenase maturation protease
MAARIAGIGQRAAGDDGVALAVLDELGRRSLPEGTALVPLRDAMQLVDLLQSSEPLVLIDALLASPAGLVVELAPHELSERAPQPSSSHGLGAAQAIELARTLSPREQGSELRVVAITISRPERYRIGLSPEVAAAVPKAADHVLRMLGGRNA